jgi:hypothetical protein
MPLPLPLPMLVCVWHWCCWRQIAAASKLSSRGVSVGRRVLCVGDRAGTALERLI